MDVPFAFFIYPKFSRYRFGVFVHGPMAVKYHFITHEFLWGHYHPPIIRPVVSVNVSPNTQATARNNIEVQIQRHFVVSEPVSIGILTVENTIIVVQDLVLLQYKTALEPGPMLILPNIDVIVPNCSNTSFERLLRKKQRVVSQDPPIPWLLLVFLVVKKKIRKSFKTM